MMDAKDVNDKYCEVCQNKEKCYILCSAVLRALYFEDEVKS